MENEIRELLDEEIKRQIEDLSSLEPGSKEQAIATESVNKLYRLKIEEDRTNWEADEKYNRRMMESDQNKFEADFKEKQFKHEAELKMKQFEHEVRVHESEEKLKENQSKAQTFSVILDCGVRVGITLLTILAYSRWYHKGLKFETTGTVTSLPLRNLISRMPPKL